MNQSKINLSEVLEVSREAALRASKIILKYSESGFSIDKKSPANLVTEADVLAEKEIISYIKEHYPNHSFLGEETEKSSLNEEHLWVIDPIDGTNNFSHGIPHVGVSIAYCVRGEPQVGVIYQPYTKEMYSAIINEGAYLNENKKLQVASASSISEAMVVTGFYYDYGPDIAQGLKTIELLIKNECHGVRRFGAASLDLCYVARGICDAYYELRLNAWDFAAGMLIVREAGGVAVNLNGDNLSLNDTKLIVGNRKIVDDLRGLVLKAGE